MSQTYTGEFIAHQLTTDNGAITSKTTVVAGTAISSGTTIAAGTTASAGSPAAADNDLVRKVEKDQCTYRISKGAIDAKTTGAVKIGTVPTGKTFIPTRIQFTMTNVNTHTAVASCSIGSVGAGYTDILANSALTGLTATNQTIGFNISAAIAAQPTGTDIYVNINTGATGTTETLEVDVFGFLL